MKIVCVWCCKNVHNNFLYVMSADDDDNDEFCGALAAIMENGVRG